MAVASRIGWIDRLKGMGMLLVILGHMTFFAPVTRWIFMFHVPLFFFASGYFFDPARYGTFRGWLSARKRTLVVPFLFFGPFGWCFSLAIGWYGGFGTWQHHPVRAIFTFLAGVRDSSLFHGPLWFVSCLFAMEAGYFVVSTTFPRRSDRTVIVALIGIVGLLVARPTFIKYPYSLDIAFLCLPFLWAGGEFRRIEGTLDRWLLPWWSFPVLLMGSIFLAFLLPPPTST